MSQLLMTMSWKVVELVGNAAGRAARTSNWLAFERAHQVLLAVRRDRARPAARAGCAA